MSKQVCVLEIYNKKVNDWLVEGVFSDYECAKNYADDKYEEDDYCIGFFEVLD